MHHHTADLYTRNISGCGLSGMMSLTGERVDGRGIRDSIALLHDRSNGLGGGFAAYGIYPDFPRHFAFHIMYYSADAKDAAEKALDTGFDCARDERIPTRLVEGVADPPLLWRYFATPKPEAVAQSQSASDEDFVLREVMRINAEVSDAYVFSSGQNMGAFKGVGYAEDIADFYRLEDYQAYIWIAHGRFPTNTPGWWAGAHPFTLLDWAVVHNGEISSYGINKRYLEMFGYRCTMRTDTEVMAYLLDLLVRRHGLPIEVACKVIAPPFWKAVDRMEPEQRDLYRALRQVYASALVNGPFAIIFAHRDGMVGVNDRIKLRPMVAARKDDFLYISSEEAAIRAMCANPDTVWSPRAGEPVIGCRGQDVSTSAPLVSSTEVAHATA
ncbi:MAG: glutamine amidotransferase family protein [Armatimonadota bacterium]|nr:MAG: glutamine amidotransferase family protein [Armatimonadota bacterium]